MRTPAITRWPEKIPAGKVSDEIVADLDWFPTIAHLIGEEARIPSDRPIDGVNQAEFLRGTSAKSAREYVVTYVGDTVFAVKWRNMKVHVATSEGTHTYVQRYTFPQVFDIKEDPKESYELWGKEGYAHAWVMGPVAKILAELSASQQTMLFVRTSCRSVWNTAETGRCSLSLESIHQVAQSLLERCGRRVLS